MRRLNRNEEGVSPIIATILMVAITVVLAATLWMMVGDFGSDSTQEQLGVSMQEHDSEGNVVTLKIGMTTPSSAEKKDVSIVVFNADGEDEFEENGLTWSASDPINVIYNGSGAGDEEIADGARLRVDFGEYDDFGGDYDGYEVQISIEGYSGQESIEL